MKFDQFGRYQIIKIIGEGGMATVYSAYDPEFDRKVAVKVLPKKLTEDPQFIERFNREARTIARLEHPSIVPVYDYGQQDGQPYLVMRYMAGGTLREYLKRQGPLSVQKAADLFSRLAPALDKAHNLGIIHRDLKPANILFDEDGNPFLSDFGIVKLTHADITLTGTQAIVGTPAYMSPEQARSKKELDGRSDIYSMAVIVFEMLTGEQPYKADTPMGLAVAHINEPIPKLSTLRGDLPPMAQDFIERGMAKKRWNRFANAKEFCAAMYELAQNTILGDAETIDALVTGKLIKERAKRLPKEIWTITIIACLLLVIVILVYKLAYVPEDIAHQVTAVNSPPVVYSGTSESVMIISPSPKILATTSPSSTTYKTNTPTIIPTESPISIKQSVTIQAPEINSQVTPVDFVHEYYETINQKQYEQAWGMLTQYFRDTHNNTGYNPYLEWWSKVDQVNIVSAQ